MRAHLRQARISPKKANLIAAMVRGLHATEALSLLEKLPKKGATILHAVLASAIANAENNASQKAAQLVIRRLIVNKGPAYRRYLPMARGRSRPIDKWTSHITVELGVEMGDQGGVEEKIMKGKKRVKGEKKVKDESDIVYSANKPVAGEYHQKASVSDAGESELKESHGHAAVQQQRRGSRGS